MKLLRGFAGLTLALCAVLASCSKNDNPATPGDTTAPARVTDLIVLSTGDSTLTVQWTAPGDDGHTGKAKSYQIRWSHAAITGSNFGSATAALNPPAPLTAGSVQQFAITGLDTTLVIHVALRARDEAGNYSQVSNDAVFSPTGDATPPARITDLAVVSAGNNSLTIQWTAPGDDGATGTASSYEVRWSASVINSGNFASATLAAGPPAPLVAGTVQQFTVTGLDTTLVTHFAMIARDDIANPSPVSNDAVWSPAVAQHLVKDIPAFKDNTMFEEDGTLSNGAGAYLFAGKTAGTGTPAVNRRALFAFAISDSLPAGAVIDSVQLTLRCSRTPSATGRATSLHRVTADWGEGTSNSGSPGGTGGAAATGDATWTERLYPATPWATAGGDFAALASASTPVGAIGSYSWKAAPMKSDVQAWLDTPANNFGWVLIGDESVSRSARRFDSRESATVANRPRLKVFYTVP